MTLAAQRLQVLCAGIFSLMLTLGVARFAYTPMLPQMQVQAGLGVVDAGWLAAINYAGYLSGALLASFIGDLRLKDRLYRWGILLAVVSTVIMATSTNLWIWGLSRFIAGLSSAAGMLLGSALILNWLMRHGQRSELGIQFSGIGLGIALCAALIAMFDPWLDWRDQWLALSVLGIVLAIPALRWLPPPDTSGKTSSGAAMPDSPPSRLYLQLFMAAYFCAGIGYVVSATFIVAIVEQLPGLSGRGNLAFLLLGIGAAPACIIWDLVARRSGELNALIMAALLQVVGILLPVLHHSLWAALLGAWLFGATFIGMVSLVLTMAGRYYPTRPARMMGRMTLAYGLAQIIGPALTGMLAARFGGYAIGLWFAAAVMLLGAFLLFGLKVVERRDRLESLQANTNVI
ncbi:YbfB/YjiJ family MFS transporter [Halopseudomonas sp.]|uniref:YbfB/YjiJ family MFS transporter n=1 Tax=Halopseudomonas sp. TaxID=2901191 RepID=UPI00356896AE